MQAQTQLKMLRDELAASRASILAAEARNTSLEQQLREGSPVAPSGAATAVNDSAAAGPTLEESDAGQQVRWRWRRAGTGPLADVP